VPSVTRSTYRSGNSDHTAFGLCNNCLAHGLPLAVHGCCRIIRELCLCEVVRSECLNVNTVV
jgi:hypothetical protein